MAPEPPDQKRKRGRPPGATESAQNASNREAQENIEEHDAEEQSRPQKRGRKSGKDGRAASPGAGLNDAIPQPGRRGRSANNKQKGDSVDTESRTKAYGVRSRRSRDQVPIEKAEHTRGEGKGKGKGKGKIGHIDEAQAEEHPPSSEHQRRGRGRQPKKNKEPANAGKPDQQVIVDSTLSPRSRPTTRQRRPREQEASTSDQRRSGRERRPLNSKTVVAMSQDHDIEAERLQVIGRMTKKQAENQSPGQAQELQLAVEGSMETKRRARPVKQDGSPEEGPSSHEKQDNEQVIGVAGQGDSSQPKRRRRPNKSDLAHESGSNQNTISRARRHRSSEKRDNPEQATKPKPKPKPKAREPEPVEEDEASSENEDLPFRHLKQTTRHISRSKISSKWKPLDSPSISTVNAILADAQRPVLQRLQNTNRRREHASSALGTAMRRLRVKLGKGFPFPPPTAGASARARSGSYEDEFEFERVVDALQTLENTLNPLLHSVGLLEKEIKKEEDALSRDYVSLHKLETNARSEIKGWREKTSKQHVLASSVKSKVESEVSEAKGRLELVPAADDSDMAGLFKDLHDEELATLSKQLGSHMDSMRSNLQQVDDVVPALAKSKAALQQVLQKHLEDGQYEKVLLG